MTWDLVLGAISGLKSGRAVHRRMLRGQGPEPGEGARGRMPAWSPGGLTTNSGRGVPVAKMLSVRPPLPVKEDGRVPVRVSTINVNGLRAAMRKGMGRWMSEVDPDILCIQETRVPAEDVPGLLGEGWSTLGSDFPLPGRAGVAIAARGQVSFQATEAACLQEGRWAEATFPTSDHRGLTIASAYAPRGFAGDEAQMAEKHGFHQAMAHRIGGLRADGRHVLVVGDLNAAHNELDISNWKAYRRHACFLPETRAHLDRLIADGWVDVARKIAGEVPGPYTCWSYRGRTMFDRDEGGRIDFHLASEDLARLALTSTVDRPASSDERWSDHAPVTVTYDLKIKKDRPGGGTEVLALGGPPEVGRVDGEL